MRIARKLGETRSKIATLFGEVGAPPQIIVAEGTDLSAVARQAVAGNERTIVAAGGDRTVGTVAAEVAGSGTTLGVLPIGTFNHFANVDAVGAALSGTAQCAARRGSSRSDWVMRTLIHLSDLHLA